MLSVLVALGCDNRVTRSAIARDRAAEMRNSRLRWWSAALSYIRCGGRGATEMRIASTALGIVTLSIIISKNAFINYIQKYETRLII